MAERRLAVLTTGRWDWGILCSTVEALRHHAGWRTVVWAAGAHCSARHGQTVTLLRSEGVEVARELETIGAAEDPAGDAARMLAAVHAALLADRPDALLLVGDRSETAAAGVAATIAGVPIVHLHGGEESEGAIDNAFRHALTKLAHLHLVSHELHAERVLQMGEAPERVLVVGPPGVDNVGRRDLPTRGELEAHLHVPLIDPVLLVTLHPTTLGGDAGAEAQALAAALETVPATIIVTQPNPDRGADAIRAVWRRWASRRPRTVVVEALGERRYWGLLRHVSAVVGNSSSGIIEAPAAGVPSVNIGDRQRGRLRPAGVIDVPAEAGAIARALADALTGRLPYRDDVARYPTGAAAPRIVAALEAWHPPVPPRKPFTRLPCAISS